MIHRPNAVVKKMLPAVENPPKMENLVTTAVVVAEVGEKRKAMPDNDATNAKEPPNNGEKVEKKRRNTAPRTSKQATSAPGTFAAGTSAPGTFAPGTSGPGTCAPATSAPGTSAPGTSVPGTSKQGSIKSAANNEPRKGVEQLSGSYYRFISSLENETVSSNTVRFDHFISLKYYLTV